MFRLSMATFIRAKTPGHFRATLQVPVLCKQQISLPTVVYQEHALLDDL